MKIEINNCYNMDCKEGMLLMRQQGLRAQWLITDPPYGIGYNDMTGGGDSACKCRDYSYKEWDKEKLSKSYFDLMFDISDNQILFGGNYYTNILPPNKKLDSVE